MAVDVEYELLVSEVLAGNRHGWPGGLGKRLLGRLEEEHQRVVELEERVEELLREVGELEREGGRLEILCEDKDAELGYLINNHREQHPECEECV